MTLSPRQGLLYGFLQGTTEVLPISSSAHLVLLPWFLEWRDPGLGFDVALHVGTLVAILWYFWRDWWELARALLESLRGGSIAGTPGARLFWSIVIASVPGAIAGLALERVAETLFRQPLLVATTLSVFGLLLGWSDHRPATRRGVASISWRDALLIGAAQAVAIVPGVSRSGVTITAARFLGLDREAAARFSFLLAAPIVAGATLLKADSLLLALSHPGPLVALLGSMVFGFLAIDGLLRYVRAHSYAPFVAYRLALAALIVFLA